MAGIFESTTINGLVLRNRLVRSATWEGLADADGRVTEPLVVLYRTLAEGGVGLIISSYLYVRRDGRQSAGQLGVDEDACVAGLSRLAEAVHAGGGALVGQIVHCGGQASREHNGGVDLVAPSAIESPGYAEIPYEPSTAEVEALVSSFAAAARRVRQAGFDGVQLHGAHGYLLAQFLSPSRNQRTDRFGGGRSGRARFALEVYDAVRAAVGRDFPVMMKINGHDFLDGSTTEDDSTYLASALAAAGLDALEVSGGTPGSGKQGAVRRGIREPEDEAYFLPQARALRQAVPNLPLMLVGGLRSLDVMERVLEGGEADYFSLSRPLLREPDLPARWAQGERVRAACTSCTKCFVAIARGEGPHCVMTKQRAAV